VQKKLTPFLKSCGYNPKKDIVFVPISGLLGAVVILPLASSFVARKLSILSPHGIHVPLQPRALQCPEPFPCAVDL
jgi:hypothetical protein